MENIYTSTTATFVAANGAVFSFQKVFDAIWKTIEIFGKVYGLCKNPDDRMDIYQEACSKAVKYAHSFDPAKSQLQTWARTIARRCIIDDYNRNMRFAGQKHLESLNRDGEEYIDPEIEMAADSYTADFRIEANEASEIIDSAIDSLSENQRQVITLRKEGLKTAEIAAIIGCKPSVVSSRLNKGCSSLKQKFGRVFLVENGIAA